MKLPPNTPELIAELRALGTRTANETADALARASASPLVERGDLPRELHVTGACDAGAHADCRPSETLLRAGGCECPHHKDEWEDLRDDRD